MGMPADMAAAGAGTPTKNSRVKGNSSSWSRSVLKRASRSIMQTAKTSETIQPNGVPCSCQM
jgi:hypothetical protein